MAGAAEVLAGVPRVDGVRYSALVPNRRGAELALQHDVDELTVTISLSETYNQRNVRMSMDESATAIGEICREAGGVPVDAVLSCSFGSPYEGDIAPAAVRALADRVREAGCAAVTCADTAGSPRSWRRSGRTWVCTSTRRAGRRW
jgi:hydroxymethylglutaryl-CoA lyase